MPEYSAIITNWQTDINEISIVAGVLYGHPFAFIKLFQNSFFKNHPDIYYDQCRKLIQSELNRKIDQKFNTIRSKIYHGQK